jgi:aspartate/methionine/tyrosine aminotransferase
LFSKRSTFPTEENELSRLRAARPQAIDLTLSNPTAAGLDYPPGLLDALADPAGLRYAPDPRGLRSAREAIAGDRADDVILCASTSEAYGWLFKLLCDPGDQVLAPRPSYPLFDYLAALEGVELVPYDLQYDGAWHLGPLPSAPRARAVLVVSPNNPTGNVLARDELRAIERLGLPVISDEVFAPYTPEPLSVADEARVLAFSLGGLSKSAALPQLKLAWIRAGGPEPARREALARLELIADTYLSVSTPVQLAAPRLLAAAAALRAQIAARVAANRALLQAAAPPAVTVLPADGGWYAVLRFPATETDEALALRLLRDHDVHVHPGYFFDFGPGTWLVVSLLPPPDVFAAGVARLFA